MFKKITLSLFLLVPLCALAAPLNVGTYNMRNGNAGDAKRGNGWEQRLPYVSGLVQFHDFDLLGTQELFQFQIDGLLKSMPGYAYVGAGRDDGKKKGEHSAIFYKKDRFQVLRNGDFWLAEDSSRPNKGWDAALPRICSWAEFRDRDSGKKLFFFNVHFDHVGVQAREESAKLLLKQITAIAGSTPSILTGDFNVDQSHQSYAILQNSPSLRDAYTTAEFKYAPNGTFNNFNPNSLTPSRIDHIFLTRHFQTKKYGVLTDSYRSVEGTDGKTYTSNNFPREVSLQNAAARLPSDHFPIKVVADY